MCKFKNVTFLLREGCKFSVGYQHMLKINAVKSTHVNIFCPVFFWKQVDDLCHIVTKLQGNKTGITFNRTKYIVVVVSEYRFRN